LRKKHNPQPPSTSRRSAVFSGRFLEDLRYWIATDRAKALRTLDLVDAVLRDPFQGIGKPEPLKFFLDGAWSRRISEEHRMVYVVRSDRIEFHQARYHY
jgi:toxin YoeB